MSGLFEGIVGAWVGDPVVGAPIVLGVKSGTSLRWNGAELQIVAVVIGPIDEYCVVG